MGNLFSGYKQTSSKTIDRVTVADEDTTLYGINCIYNLTTPTAARTITLADYDRGNDAVNGIGNAKKPVLIIKCKVDCSGFNITIADSASTTLYTLSTNQAAAELYLVFRVKDDNTWELA